MNLNLNSEIIGLTKRNFLMKTFSITDCHAKYFKFSSYARIFITKTKNWL